MVVAATSKATMRLWNCANRIAHAERPCACVSVFGPNSASRRAASVCVKPCVASDFCRWNASANGKTKQEVNKSYNAVASKKKNGVIGYVQNDGFGGIKIHLNGGKETDAKHLHATAGTYAHELGHAVDADDKFSSKVAWKNAWESDIFNGKHLLSNYARESPSEGFAEVYRVLVEHGVDSVKNDFPNVHKFLSKEGLI